MISSVSQTKNYVKIFKNKKVVLKCKPRLGFLKYIFGFYIGIWRIPFITVIKGMLQTLKEKIVTSKIKQLPRFQKIPAPQQINLFTSGLLLRHGTYLKLRGKLFRDLNSAWNFLETDQEKIRHGFSGRPVRTYPGSERCTDTVIH